MQYENDSFEKPLGVSVDETDISLRAYMTRIPERKLAAYDPSWSDEQVMTWDDNFRDDGELFLVCCERDVGVAEFREVLHEYLEFRSARRPSSPPARRG